MTQGFHSSIICDRNMRKMVKIGTEFVKIGSELVKIGTEFVKIGYKKSELMAEFGKKY